MRVVFYGHEKREFVNVDRSDLKVRPDVHRLNGVTYLVPD